MAASSKPQHPEMVMVYDPQADPIPRYCPKCLSREPHARKQCDLVAAPPGVVEYFAGRGYRVLAECSGCMSVLAEVI